MKKHYISNAVYISAAFATLEHADFWRVSGTGFLDI